MAEITVEIDDAVFIWLAQEAHRQDITLNRLVNNILTEEMDRVENQIVEGLSAQ